MTGARTALILTGGGARAAYQVGVLKAVRELLPEPARNPFPILCGTSAGALNAATLAAGAADFGAGVGRLLAVWENFRAPQVYRSDAAGIGAAGARWLSALAFGWITRRAPRSLLDNAPLRSLLDASVDFSGIASAIDSGALHSLSITCSGYSSGQSVSFFQGRPGVAPWRRSQRVGAPAAITLDHLMASSAIPFVFPAVHINREWFGDGSMRQMAPISPAIHLGADRILVIGAGRTAEEGRVRAAGGYPSPAQIAGHALSSIFLDTLEVDLERLARINDTVGRLDEARRAEAGIALRPLECLVIQPSQRLDIIAARHAHSLPAQLRIVLRGLGTFRREGSTLLSYLLFEPSFTRALIELGYHDAMTRAGELRRFLRIDS